MTVMAVALSTGLYATHTMVPPTPGPIAAAGTLGADLGKVILLGLIAAIPASLSGLLWATKFAKRYEIEARNPRYLFGNSKKIRQITKYTSFLFANSASDCVDSIKECCGIPF